MKKPRIFWREARVAALDTAAGREAELRDGSLARGSASAAAHFAQNIGHLQDQRAAEVAALRLQRSIQGDLARRELRTGLSAPMRDLQNRDPEAFADAMDMSFRLAPRRSRPGHTSRPGRD